jgi:phospholipid-transporting ATPase
MEIVKFVQSTMIDNDLDIYYDKTNTPALARSSSLIEELGQIEYVFSDKTGTLTCNEMEFRECSIAGLTYANHANPDRQPTAAAGYSDSEAQYSFKQMEDHLESAPQAPVIREFLTALMTCHTVIPEVDASTGNTIYQASSPDEAALVKGASSIFGYHFYARRPHSIHCTIQSAENEYQILNVCEFNSTRKRMSVVLRDPQNRIVLYCKGADTMILERLDPDCPYVDATLTHLEVRTRGKVDKKKKKKKKAHRT